MIKKLIIAALALGILAVSLPVAGYFYAKSHKQQLIQLVADKAKEQGIELSFAQEANESPFYFSFSKFQLSGASLPYHLVAESASVGPRLNASWPPLSVLLQIKKPLLSKNEQYSPNPSANESAAAPLPPMVILLSGWVLPLTQLQVNIEEAEAPSWGIHGLTLSSSLKSLRLNPFGISHAMLDHELSIRNFDKNLNISPSVPIPGFLSKGRVHYEPPLVRTTDHTVSFGPFTLQTNSKYSLDSQKWSSDIYIPETLFKSDAESLNPGQLPWLKSLTGQLYLKANIQGLGSDVASINSEGTLIAKKMEVEIEHADAKGKAQLDINTAFAKNQSLNLDSHIKVDLSSLEIKKDELFKKPVGIPLDLQVEILGQDRNYSIKQLVATFHNLKASVAGSVTSGPQTIAALKIKIPATDLQGWEQFFPKFSAIKTTGSLALDANYSGPIQDWKSSALELDLEAKDVRLPILNSWLPTKEFSIDGLVHVDSETQISYLKGVLKNLATTTSINLKENQLSYSNLFHKAAGIPMETQLSISSSATKADIKRGTLNIGNLRANLIGTISNFNSPTANLKIETGNWDTQDLLSLSPSSAQKTFTQIHGKLLSQVTIIGPLTDSKELPQIKGTTKLNRIALNYLPDTAKKPIQVKDISGVVAFSNDSISGKKLKLKFPQTDLTVDFDLHSFEKPKLNFTISGNRFTSTDFLEETPKAGGGPSLISAGSAPVALTATTGSNADGDFRKNPYLNTAQVKGTINFKDFTLSGTTAQQFAAKVTYDRLLLNLSPLSFKAFGGAITSNTIWDGREKEPTTAQTIKIEGVDANQFLSNASENAKDLIAGKLSSEMKLALQGMTPAEIKKSLKGQGSFTLSEGKLKTVRLTQKPLESLKKLPFLSKAITKTDWDERLNEATGEFRISEGKLSLSSLVLHSPYFDATTEDTTLDFDQNINSKFVLLLKDSVIDKNSLAALNDSSGRPAIPLTLSGPVRSPTVGLDESVIEARVKAFALKKGEEEAKRALSQVKGKAQEELEKKLKQGLGGFFK